MAEFFFYTFLSLLGFTLFGYPCVLYVFRFFKNRTVNRQPFTPSVEIVIPVHNEELSIAAKIENCLAFDYPKEKMRIIVASDCSTDRTDDIVRGYGSQNVDLVSIPFRGGKVMAQNHALMHCNSEIIIFTDVAIRTDPNCLKAIAENFHDPKIGVVSCRDAIVRNNGASQGEGSYIKYDMMVRKLTSQIASLIGVTGGFYAVRREIAVGGWNPAFPPDFYVAMRCIKKGQRAIEDPRVRAYYKTAAKEWDELQRKVRTLNRGMQTLFSAGNIGMLNPFRYGIVAFELFSHKLLRWLTPFFLIGIFLSNWVLAGGSTVYRLTFALQCVFYAFVLLAFCLRHKESDNPILRLGRYFSIANLAMLKAWYELLIGKKYAVWQPTRR